MNQIVDRIFSIRSNKISSLFTDENSLKFSSKSFHTVEEFKDSWNKKISLATKLQIRYDSIKSITKEDKEKDILIKYKTWAGIASDCQFHFLNNEDYEAFFNFMVREKYFLKTHEVLTPYKAIRNYIVGLIIVIGITIFGYYHAVRIAKGFVEEASSDRVRAFNSLIELLGDKGVLAIGSLVGLYLIYKIWKRFYNPPNQTVLLPLKV